MCVFVSFVYKHKTAYEMRSSDWSSDVCSSDLIARSQMSRFDWSDPFNLDDQLTDDERMIRDSARAYAQEKLQPRVIEAYANEHTDPERSEERRVGKESVSTCRYRWST